MHKKEAGAALAKALLTAFSAAAASVLAFAAAASFSSAAFSSASSAAFAFLSAAAFAAAAAAASAFGSFLPFFGAFSFLPIAPAAAEKCARSPDAARTAGSRALARGIRQ